MPKLTNKTGLPLGLVRAIEADPYDNEGADITASSIGDPPLLQMLKKKHRDDIEEDAADRIWALLGQAAHAIAERGAAKLPDGQVLSEVRLAMDVLGWKLSGAMDHFSLESGTLSDMKVTSAWTLVYGDRLEDWEKQLNVLAELLAQHGHTVTALEVTAILRDWSARDVERINGYPKANAVTVPLELWSQEKRLAYIEERVRLHQNAAAGIWNPCTDEERWMKVDKKTGKKTYIRCQSYCSVAPFCPVLAAEKGEAA